MCFNLFKKKLDQKGVEPWVSTLLLIFVTLTLIAVVATLIGGLGANREFKHTEYWDRACKVNDGFWASDIIGEYEVTAAERDNILDHFITYRLVTYDENWRKTDFTCTYGWFVERVL